MERAEGVESREHLGDRGGGGMVEDPDPGGGTEELVVLFAVQGFSQVSFLLKNCVMQCSLGLS